MEKSVQTEQLANGTTPPVRQRPLRLVHLANWHSTNVGNGALIQGLERVIHEDLGNRVSFVPEAWDDYTLADRKRFDERFVDLINAHDGLLVGGAVMLNGMRRYRHTGSRLDLEASLWERIRKPVVFYSIARSVFPRQHYYHLGRWRVFLERLLGSDRVLFSVRNDGTKGWLETVLGRRDDRIIEVPDPALYVPVVDGPHPELEPGKLNVIVAVNAEAQVYRFGGGWPDRLWRYVPFWKRHKARVLAQLARTIDRLVEHHGAHIILCPHCPSDHAMMAELIAHCPTRVTAQSMATAPGLKAIVAPHLYDLYRKADMAISMRIHSATCAIGVGTPVIGLTPPGRMEYSMRDMGLEEFAIRLLDPAFGKRLDRIVDRIIHDRVVVQARVRAVYPVMRERTRRFHQQLATFLGE